MALLRLSDGRTYHLSHLEPTSGWKVDSYGKQQLESNCLVLAPSEYADGKKHLLYMSEAVFRQFKSIGLDRTSEYTVRYVVEDGKKSWKIAKGAPSEHQKDEEVGSTALDCRDAILSAVTLLEAAQTFLEDTDSPLDPWQLALIASLVAGKRFRTVQEKMNTNELDELEKAKKKPEW